MSSNVIPMLRGSEIEPAYRSDRHDPVPGGRNRGMIISKHTPHQQICLLLGRVGVTQHEGAAGLRAEDCWRLGLLVLLGQAKRTKKSSLPVARQACLPQAGLIPYLRDHTEGYLITHLNSLDYFSKRKNLIYNHMKKGCSITLYCS
ncbi:hypothetical protein J2X69_004056 [Algoriphagus sp. 4150]|nr:hypothetical protein [Algoriphagus sp. 4150]